MKTRIAIAIVLLAMLGMAAPAAHAQEALPEQLKYIDAQLEIFTPKLAAFQADYFHTNSEYYQALGTHDKAPATADVVSDLKAKPSDQLMDLGPLWDYAGLPASINWSFIVNVAVTPTGPGYTLVVQTTVKDVVWECTVTTIPGEKNRPWQIRPPVEDL